MGAHDDKNPIGAGGLPTQHGTRWRHPVADHAQGRRRRHDSRR